METIAKQTKQVTRDVFIIAPTGQDAKLLSSVLLRENIGTRIFRDVADACPELNRHEAGALLIAEEALSGPAITTLNETLSLQEPWSDIPLVIMTSNGEPTLASLRVLKAFASSGNVTLLERPFRPITMVSTLQVALRARQRQFQVKELLELQIQATRIRDEFISIASHELKTPLTSLKLQTQLSERMILKGNPAAFDPEKIKKLVLSTGNQVDRLTRLVEDMLDVSRISSGKLNIQKETFDLSELVQELVERFSPQLSAASCEVSLETKKPIIGLWDRYRIEQVLSNLLTNVIRYSPNGPVVIRTELVQDMAKITVADSGPGIAPENHERIFNRFERAVHSKSISGLGLGLYICREIIESHQGSIRVESELGKGSRFIVELPVS